MEDAFELAYHLPVSCKAPNEQEYIAFLWDAFKANYEAEKYQFSFLAYHMLTMSFVYVNIWQIKEAWPDDFKKGLIGFSRDENDLLDAASPFVFSKVNERTVPRFLRLIGCDDGKIDSFRDFVKTRNDIAHAQGSIVLGTQAALDARIGEILRAVDDIQTRCKPVIERCYREFLLQSRDPEKREYTEVSDQIHEVLIKGNYISEKDVEICSEFDIAALRKRAGFNQIGILHQSLCEAYGTREDNE